MSLFLSQRPARRLFNERRNDGRDRAAQNALVRTSRGGSTECSVRDLSDGGARLRFLRPGDVADRFEIKIGAASRWRRVRVCWRRGEDIGVAFE